MTDTHYYKPSGAAHSLFHYRDSEVLLSGPAGTGKSRACLEKLHIVALKYPGMRGLIVRKTLASLGSTALVTWRENVINQSQSHVVYYGGSSQDPPQYKYSNGSAIIIGGMDKASKIMSSEYDMIFVQEATELTEDDWEALTTRLRNGKMPYQQLLADCNPHTPTHWLKQRSDKGATKLFESRHEDNPVLFYEDGKPTLRGQDYMAKLDRLTGVRYLRLRKGIWAAAEGLVFEDWDSNVHLVDRFPIPWEWPRYWTIDFGFVNPFVCQWWAEDPDGKLILYREIYRTGKTVEKHCIDILGQVLDHNDRWVEPRPRFVICDHDAENRAVLEDKLGFSTKAAHKAVTEGIQAVQDRMTSTPTGIQFMRDSLVYRDETLVTSGKPTCTIEEVVGYIWDIGPNKKKKETPVKEDDHGMDATRYMVADRDLVGSPSVRFM